MCNTDLLIINRRVLAKRNKTPCISQAFAQNRKVGQVLFSTLNEFAKGETHPISVVPKKTKRKLIPKRELQ